METGIVNALILSGLFLSLFAVAELLYHCCKVRAEFTRKIVHAGTGLLALLFPLMLDNHWWVLVLCTSFTILLICSVHFRLLRSIHAIDRRSVGSLAYPVAVYGCYLSYTFLNNQLIYYYLPILILAISDPLAALSGKRWPLGAYQIRGAHKTMLGSLFFFISAYLIMLVSCLIFRYPLQGQELLVLALLSIITALTEALSRDGYDNVTIPFAVSAGFYIFDTLII
ncbi:Cytidylyltransferase family [Sphingobacterium spiritivorum]|uniref:Cytidylyltransferase family n=1 Tax=Sphingobacterium spiritivorum TaxID=258 RepID=A0A380C8C3_SPHSI|nr:phosphatidate cytidylyltransferase [Sphingobacterium spiritivorum]SUJ15048.1 Cytidylyltransferase family [Sphingobacterium spiritivorum]